jgi:hypothetical protein
MLAEDIEALACLMLRLAAAADEASASEARS